MPLTTTYRDNLKETPLLWLPVAVGLMVLYLPTFYDLANGLWTNDEQIHGPIILMLSLWLIYRKWPEMIRRSEGQPAASSGWVVFVLAMMLYSIGRSQHILVFEIGSFILILCAVLLITRGGVAL